ncbi:unnamed protein product, partial [Thlaspi arvense]
MMKGPFGRFWFGVGGGILSAIVVYVIGLRGSPKAAMQSSTVFFSGVVPPSLRPDDMPAHIKSSMFGCQLTIPITKGKLNMGTWQ